MTEEDKKYLTKEKYDELKKELDFLKNTRRKEIAGELEYAKSLGDLSENAEYNEARDSQAKLEGRIGKIEVILQNVEIISRKKSDIIDLGSTTTIRRKGEKEKKEFLLVGSEEADSLSGKISYESPLGRALLGKKKGDEAMFKRPDGEKIIYEILKVS